MRITCIRKMEYRGYLIYVMQFNWTFQYLFADTKGDVWQDHRVLKPGILARLKHFLMLGSLYTADQVHDGEKIILSGAIRTIDKIDKPGFEDKRRKLNKKQAKKKCLWQTRQTEDGPYYACLTHGKIVKMKDDEKPKHD